MSSKEPIVCSTTALSVREDVNLQEAVAKAREESDDVVLVAKPPFTWASEATYAVLTDEFRVPSQIADKGFEVVLDHEDLITQLDYLAEKKSAKEQPLSSSPIT